MIRVVAPSRLHFGLFRVPTAGGAGDGAPAFGGLGLLIDRPGVVVDVRPADSWRFEGALASRAQAFAARFMASLPEAARRQVQSGEPPAGSPDTPSRFQLLVERCPAEHTGLGVGTQLGLAVAKALAVACGAGDLPSTELAARVGRGERSAIGVYGFDRGGLIADAGKEPGAALAPLLAHVALPAEWKVVLFTPPGAARWHGDRERAAFATAHGGDPGALRELADAAVRAAHRADLCDFGDAVHEFNRKAGEPFAAAQGGPYAGPEVASLIEDVRAAGVRAVGQSSWGPTVFAVVPDSDAALSLALRFRARAPALVAGVSSGHTVA
ncbi:MAG: beta-ribofuranosylaminobenzene 5'-phosphate synthase [Planctomycetes bacterium]|nr:beta-ribofuranosylaminobenzene 5'-phosphate synthase [Planctomycetota bacterium]